MFYHSWNLVDILVTSCLDVQSSSIIWVDIQTFETVFNSYFILIKPLSLYPSDIFPQFFDFSFFKGFQVIFLRFKKSIVIVASISQSNKYLPSISIKNLSNLSVNLDNLSIGNVFSAVFNHKANSKKVKRVFSQFTSIFRMLKPFFWSFWEVILPILDVPKSNKVIDFQEQFLDKKIS